MTHDAEQRIRERAYHLWEAEGRPHGRDHEFWERAAKEEHAHVHAAPKPAKAVPKAASEKPAAKPVAAGPGKPAKVDAAKPKAAKPRKGAASPA